MASGFLRRAVHLGVDFLLCVPMRAGYAFVAAAIQAGGGEDCQAAAVATDRQVLGDL